MELAFFQLENLIVNRNQFIFLDLRQDHSEQLPEPLAKYLKAAVQVAVFNVEEYLNSKKINKESPIVLVCQCGLESKKAAQGLEQAGYDNIYVIAGGVVGLLSELG